jgi:hypothetical protein
VPFTSVFPTTFTSDGHIVATLTTITGERPTTTTVPNVQNLKG